MTRGNIRQVRAGVANDISRSVAVVEGDFVAVPVGGALIGSVRGDRGRFLVLDNMGDAPAIDVAGFRRGGYRSGRSAARAARVVEALIAAARAGVARGVEVAGTVCPVADIAGAVVAADRVPDTAHTGVGHPIAVVWLTAEGTAGFLCETA